ncbi:MAG: hypothetical protein KKA32_06065 [Actinobacteria bacterium]|nr:hypothetical protein [Actinomycetota bacterium]
MAKPKFVLLDAGPVIALHEAKAWTQFCTRYDVVVPESVVMDEALWHSRDATTGFRETIDVKRDAEAGRVRVVSADSDELTQVARRFSAGFIDALHEGELEALAILSCNEHFSECAFCSGDGAAIQAAAMAGLAERCVALETLLDGAGLKKPVTWAFTAEFSRQHRDRGLENLITGFGMRR